MKIKIIILFTFILSKSLLTFEPVFNLTNYKLDYKIDTSDYSGFTLLPPVDSMKPNWALILSGGGVRGVAQIGVLKLFEENDISPKYIIGTSIGAFIGGLYSSGYSADDLISIIDTTKWNEIFSLTETKRSEYFYDQKIINDRSLLKLRFKNFKLIVPKSLTSGSKFNIYLQALFLNSLYHSNDDYNKLKYIFRPVATDLVTGKSIAFRKRNIINTVRASGTFPLWTLPVEMDSMILVDGGLFENIPTRTAKDFFPDGIISVNTVSPLLKADELNKPWNIADQVVSVMMKSFTDSLKKLSDFEIKPDLKGHKNTDFNGLNSLITQGYNAAKHNLPQIKTLLDSIFREKIEDLASQFPDRQIALRNIEFSPVFNEKFKEAVINQLNGDKTTYKELLFAFYSQFSTSGEYISPMYQIQNDNILLSAIVLPVIRRIEISNNIISTDNFSDSLTEIYSNVLLNRKNFIRIAETIIQYFREKGYSYAFYHSISFKNGTLFFHIKKGVISQIKLNPEIKPDSFLVTRELIFNKNDYINSDKIIKSYENLISSELFTNVNIDIEKETDTSFTTNLSMIEQGNQLISLGVLINNERYLQVGIDLVQHNLFNKGLRLNLRAAGGIRNFYSHISLMQQRILNTLFTAEIKGYYYNTKRWVFDHDWNTPRDRFRDTIVKNTIEQGFGFKASTGFQLFRLGNVNIEYRYEKQRHHMEDELANQYYTINTIKFNSVYDNRDNIFFPKKGRFLQLSLETTLFPTKNDVSFSKLLFEYQTNWNFRHNTIRPHFMFGFADKTLPQNEFFNLGGLDMFYGYRENESRGRQLVLGSLEYEYKAPFKILFDTYFSFRYNVGTTWEEPEEIKFASLKHGIGLSVGFDTPIGPAKFAGGEAFYFRKSPFMLVRGYLNLYFTIGVKI